MVKYIFSVLLLLLNLSNLQAQKRDNVWILGYYAGEPQPGDDTIIGIQKIIFKNNQPQISRSFEAKININKTNCSISDKEGNLLFFFNGTHLYNKNLELAKGENNINVDSTFTVLNSVGPQLGLMLPFPNDETKSILFSKMEISTKIPGKIYTQIYTREFNAAILKNKGNDGLGEVIRRRITIIKDTLDLAKVTATKHANGRDWWIIVQRYYDNTYYKVLVTPQEIKVMDKQVIGIDRSSFYGQAIFTPDGSKYISFENGADNGSPHLVIFDFDRCTGQISNPVNIFLGENEYPGGGAAVSPNGRFLYVTFYSRLIQFDLWAKDIDASQKVVADYDGFLFLNSYRTGFYLMQLAPDSKIYISTSGASPFLHVINKPDLEGTACDVVQRAIKLPYINAWSVPNHPNYRLGALKGSPCDNLGILGANEERGVEKIKIYPNPAQDILNIQLPASTPSATIILKDIQGRRLKSIALQGNAQIDTSDLPDGLIVAEAWVAGQRVSYQRVVIIH